MHTLLQIQMAILLLQQVDTAKPTYISLPIQGRKKPSASLKG